MGIMVSKNLTDKNELSKRISADLRARTVNDGVSDKQVDSAVEMAADEKKTGRFAWVWLVLIVLAAISLITIAMI